MIRERQVPVVGKGGEYFKNHAKWVWCVSPWKQKLDKSKGGKEAMNEKGLMNERGGGGLIALAVIGVLAVVLLIAGCGIRNGIIGAENTVEQKWGDVEASYQRRLDVLPKFAKNAQFSVDFQLKLNKDYVQQREGIKNAAASGDPNALQKAANDGYQALLIAVRQEAVPQAKLDQLTELNAQIENVERVINHERKGFNDAVRRYNDNVRTFPGSMFGYQPKKPFKAEEGAEKSPDYDLKLR